MSRSGERKGEKHGLVCVRKTGVERKVKKKFPMEREFFRSRRSGSLRRAKSSVVGLKEPPCHCNIGGGCTTLPVDKVEFGSRGGV